MGQNGGTGFRTYWELTHRERFRRGLWLSPLVCIGVLAMVLLLNHPSSLADYWPVAFAVVWCGALLAYNYVRMRSDDAASKHGE